MRKKSAAIIFACVVFALVVFLGWFAESVIKEQVSTNITTDYLSQENQLATQIASNLENEISNVTNKLYVVATIPEINNTADTAACNARLQQILVTPHQKLSNLGRVGVNGNFVCSLNKALIGVPGSKLGSYIPQIFADPNHNPVMSSAIKPPGATGYLVGIHVPVYNSQGTFDGTLGGAILLSDIYSNFLKNVKIAENGYASLVDSNGDILAGPLPALVGKNLSSPEVIAQIGNRGVKKWQEAVVHANTGDTGTVDYSTKGVAKLATYHRSAVLPGRNWVVIVAVPKQDAVNALTTLGLNQAFGLIGLLLMVATGLVTALLLITNLRSISLQRALSGERDRLELERSRALILLSSIGDGVVAIDRSWNITLFNDMAASVTGWTAAEAVGKPLRTIMPFIREFDRQEDMTFIEQAMVTGKPQNLGSHMLLKRRDGTELPVGDSASPILGPDAQVLGAIIVFRSIAEEKEEQRMKSDFAYASHQFRTPLTQILSALGLLEMAELPADAKENVEAAMIGVRSIQKLTGDLLAASDVENKRIIPKLVNIDLASLIQHAWKPLTDQAEQCGLTLETHLSDDLPTLTSDVVLLERIVHELLDNACQYGDAKTSVSISARTENDQFILSIENHGAHISEEELPLIYTKFFRGSNKPATSAGGGLGLYIAKQYTELLGGRMWFTSKDHVTVFYLSLPLRRVS